jgi:hypothetical protein
MGMEEGKNGNERRKERRKQQGKGGRDGIEGRQGGRKEGGKEGRKALPVAVLSVAVGGGGGQVGGRKVQECRKELPLK